VIEDEGYVYRREVIIKKVKIPDGYVKCKACGGSGEIRIRYGPPWDRGQFQTCWFCHGQGYIKKEWAEELDKQNNFFWRNGASKE